MWSIVVSTCGVLLRAWLGALRFRRRAGLYASVVVLDYILRQHVQRCRLLEAVGVAVGHDPEVLGRDEPCLSVPLRG